MKNSVKMIGLVVLAVVITFFIYLSTRNQPARVSVDALPVAEETQSVTLKDGESFELSAYPVKKTINGQTVKMLAYNGSIPGPLIEVEQGAEVTVHFTNNTDIATTIHPHGVRVENANDGVPDVTQALIQPGQDFTYALSFPDAGVYWYHPHFREDYAQELGLYGNFLVKPSDDAYWSAVNGEAVVFLDDILLDKNGAAFNKEVADHTLMGRFGNVMLVNGSTDYRLQVPAGAVERFYLTNAANTRPFNIAIPGAKLKLVGADNGKYEKETFVESVLLGPSERAIVEAYFPKAGAYPFVHRTPGKVYTLGTITADEAVAQPSLSASFNMARLNSDVIASIDPFRAEFNRAPDKVLRLTLNMRGMGGPAGTHQMQGGGMMMDSQMGMSAPAGGIEWEDDMGAMNEGSTSQTLVWQLRDEATGAVNMDIHDWDFRVGDRVKVRVINDAHSMHPMQHPIHFHGQRFLILSRDGQKETNMVWKDTAFIPAGQTVDLLIEMSNPGIWMAHCHISEHLEAGMMLQYRVQ